MTDERMPQHEEPTESAEETAIRRLIGAAGRGAAAAPEARARVRAQVEATWRRTIAERRARRRRTFWAAAAAALLTATVLWIVNQAPEPKPPAVTPEFASISKVQGPVFVVDGAERHRLPPGAGLDEPVRLGEMVLTGSDGRAALELANGISLRLDEETALDFAATEEATLERGRVYLDSGDAGDAGASEAARRFELATPLGSVRHLGTQYEVEVADRSLTIRVREGSVAVRDGDRRLLADAGEQIIVPQSGSPLRSTIETHGPSWSWAEHLAAVRGPDPYPVFDLLEWIARETGRRLQFASPEIEAKARSLTLHGVAGLAPHEALEVFGGTTGLEYSEREGVLLVTSAPGA